MQSKATTIKDYLASLPARDRSVIAALDQLVRTNAPSAAGSMKYGMPTYEIQGRMLAFNAQKNYYSIYADPELVKRHRSALGDLDVGKSCIRFRKLEDISLETLTQIISAYTE